MTELFIPDRLEALRESNSGFYAGDSWNPCDLSDSDVKGHIEDLARLGSSDEGLDELEQDTIDAYFSLISNFSSLTNANKNLFYEAATVLTASSIESTSDSLPLKAKNARKIVAFFFVTLLQKIEAFVHDDLTENASKAGVKGRGKKAAGAKGRGRKNNDDDADNDDDGSAFIESWPACRAICLDLIMRMLCADPSYLWTMSIVPDNFLKPMWSTALDLLVKRPVGVSGTSETDKKVRNLCMSIIIKCTSLFSGTGSSLDMLAAALMESIISAEHMTGFVAEICSKCSRGVSVTGEDAEESSVGGTGSVVSASRTLCSELMTEISHMKMNSRSSGGESSTGQSIGVKNIGMFIEKLAVVDPELMTQHLAVLKVQIDSPAFQIRSSLLQAMGEVVAHIHRVCEKLDAKKNNPAAAANNDGDDCRDATNNVNHLTRVRDTLLDILVERTHDKSHFTRAAVLKVWMDLLSSGAVPVRRMTDVAEVAVDRLKDKTAIVRKSAVSLLTALLDNNPFSANLDESTFAARKQQLDAAIAERVAVLRENALIAAERLEDALAGNAGAAAKEDSNADPSVNVVSDDEQDAVNPEEADPIEDDDEFLESADVREDAEIIGLRTELEFVTSALKLLAILATSISKIEELVQSKTASDVVEAVRFFVRAVNFNVKNTKKGLQGTFSLVWHQEESIRKECLEAFKHAYLTDGASVDARALPADEIASNLVHVYEMCDVSESTSMEQIIGELFKTGQVELKVLDSLWAFVSRSNASTTSIGGLSLTGILSIIAMIAKFMPEIMTPSKIKLIVQVGLRPPSAAAAATPTEGDADLTARMSVMKAAAKCLQAGPAYVAFEGSPAEAKLASDAELQAALLDAAPALRDIIIGAFCTDSVNNSRRWFSVCEEATHALFHTHPNPDKVFASIIAPLFASLSNGGLSSGERIMASPACLSRLLFVLGQGALGSLVYTERLAGMAKKANDKKAKEASASAAASAQESGGDKEVDAMEEEMGMAAAADADHDRLFNLVVERQLVFENILGKFHAIIAYVVANEKGTFSDPIIRETALLALCRYMSVSSVICEMYLPLLFTAFEKEQDPLNRTTIMVALGDLAFRFPNALEPWTARMYAKLSDDRVLVRYNTLMVLTHLILNDMIKVKGQVSHVVMCLNDPNEKVRDLAHLFFVKLSERSNNPVYNLLGDIIATLSRDRSSAAAAALDDSVSSAEVPSTKNTATKSSVPVVEDDEAVPVVAVASVDIDESTLPQRVLSSAEFQSTMTFLLQFVKKDKQADSMLERLLVRLGMAQSNQARRNLAFCIAQLPPASVKGLKKMVELFKFIKDALHDDQVHEHIQTALTRAGAAVRVGTAKSTSTAASSSSSSNANATAAVVAAAEEGVNLSADAEGGSSKSSGEVKALIKELKDLIAEVRGDTAAAEAAKAADGDDDTEVGDGDGENKEEEGGDGSSKSKVKPTGTADRSGAAKKAAAKGGKGGNAAKGKKTAPRRKKAAYSDDDDEEENEEASEEEEEENDENSKPAAAAQNSRGRGAAQSKSAKTSAGNRRSAAAPSSGGRSLTSKSRRAEVVSDEEDLEEEELDL